MCDHGRLIVRVGVVSLALALAAAGCRSGKSISMGFSAGGAGNGGLDTAALRSDESSGVGGDKAGGPLFRFGLIADCQYHKEPGTGRKYSLSDRKLAECVNDFNSRDLAFVCHLGDFIDRDFESFDVLGPIFDRLQAKTYHVIGNHDYSVVDERKAEVPAVLGLDKTYYDFAVQGMRFVVLDGTHVSFHPYAEGTPEKQAAKRYYDDNNIQLPTWNGALGNAQLAWLKRALAGAQERGERVILFCHFPAFPENIHNLWNAEAVMNLIEPYDCVIAYINGHNHHGNYGRRAGIHYVTLKAMVDTETNSYAVVDVFDDRLEVAGFGRESRRVLPFR